MKNITLTCPVCLEGSRAVGDPDESDNGHSGDWFCFNCHSKGEFSIELEVTVDGTTDTD